MGSTFTLPKKTGELSQWELRGGSSHRIRLPKRTAAFHWHRVFWGTAGLRCTIVPFSRHERSLSIFVFLRPFQWIAPINRRYCLFAKLFHNIFFITKGDLHSLITIFIFPLLLSLRCSPVNSSFSFTLTIANRTRFRVIAPRGNFLNRNQCIF